MFAADEILDRLDQQKSLLTHIERMSGIAAGKRRPKPEAEPGDGFILDVAIRVAQKAGRPDIADQLRAKAAVLPAMTGTPGWAVELVPSGLPGVILSATVFSAFAQVLRRSPQLTALSGTLKIPVAAIASPASIVSEGAPIPLSKGSLSALTMGPPWKFASLMSFTEELSRVSNIEAVTRLLLQQSIGLGIDLAALSANPPAGILGGLTPVTASTAPDALTAISADLAALVAALTYPSADVVFITHISQWTTAVSLLPGLTGRIFPSSSVAAKTVIAIDPNGLAASLDNQPSILLSEAAAVHESDAPTALAIAGSPNSIAAPMRSGFQTDSIIAKIVFHAVWSLRPGSVAIMNSVKW